MEKLKELIIKFHDLLRYERLNDCHFHYESDILSLYKDILSTLVESHPNYWDYYPKFLYSLEENSSPSLLYSIKIFLDLFDSILIEKKLMRLNLSITKYKWSGKSVKKYMNIFLENGYTRNKSQRLSEEYFNLDLLKDVEKIELISFFRDTLHYQGEKINWNNEDVETALMYVIPLRQLLLYFKMPELFYFLAGSVVERLSTSEFYQINRDFVEEIIMASYKDKVPELGFVNAFKAYSNANSIHASLMFVNLSLVASLIKKPPYHHEFVLEIGRQVIRLFRNVGLVKFILPLYQKLQHNLNLSDYEKNILAHAYYSSLIADHTDGLPDILLDFLRKERETLFKDGIHSAIPWLTLLYNIRRIYPDADFSPTGLGFFVNVFESIVPHESINRIKDILTGDSTMLKSRIKESLIKLNETRNTSDFVYDNEISLTIASRLIQESFKNYDNAGFILAMMLKSDFSILFRPKEVIGTMPLKLPKLDLNDFDLLYEHQDDFNAALQLKENTAILWIGFSESKIYTLTLHNKEYGFSLQDQWDYDKYLQLLKQDYFFDFSFAFTIKEKGEVRLITNEEYINQSNEVKKELQSFSLLINKNIESIYLVKDLEISGYPHNLLLDENKNFIALRMPITNVLSTEWLLFRTKNSILLRNYSKSIWIPIESGDLTINYLYNNIENTLNKYQFQINTQSEMLEKMSSDINIVCSHGAQNISETHLIFQEGTKNCDVSSVISNGKILIFFVCYSGSMKTESFRNSIASVVLQAIALGYEAIIAPCWGLNASIPEIWLPIFLESMDNGYEIQQAVFKANMKVFEQYSTPAAWACLHLYGNPKLKLDIS